MSALDSVSFHILDDAVVSIPTPAPSVVLCVLFFLFYYFFPLILEQGLAGIFYKGLDTKDFQLCGPYSLSPNFSTLHVARKES